MAGTDADGGWDVFVSYASSDRAAARTLVDALVGAGVSVCFDQDVLRPGDDWHALLPRYLRQSSVVVALVSENTGDAHFERAEVLRAVDLVRNEGGRLVPVRLADVEPPFGTEMLHHVDAFDDVGLVAAAEAIANVVRDPELVVALPARNVWSPEIPVISRWFTGRAELLAKLARRAGGGSRSVVTQAMTGMGGVGKTTVAAAYAEEQREHRDIVWWVRCEDPATLVGDLAALGARVGAAPGERDADERAELTRRWLETTDRSWLVVYDNVVDEASVEPWLPRFGGGQVVMTSRNRDLDRLGEIVETDTFDTATAVEFLAARLRERDPAAAADGAGLSSVATKLQGLPLALEQAASWVTKAPTRTLERFIELFDDATEEPFPDGTRPIGYDATAVSTWRVSIDAAEADAPAAARLMAILGFVAPTRLPIAWLTESADDPFLDTTADEVLSGLEALYGYSLVDLDAGSVAVHRVVQYAARRSAFANAASCAISVLRSQLPGRGSNHVNWPVFVVMAPHVAALAGSTDAALPESANDLCWLLQQVASYQRTSGNVAAAIHTSERALAIAEAQLGRDHERTLAGRQNLAEVYDSAGRLNEAIHLYETTAADRQRILGDDHIATLITRAMLARSYRSVGRLDDAIEHLEQTASGFERVLGEDHTHSITSLNDLANAYREAGRLDDAIPLFQTAITRYEQLLGEDHPHTLTSRNNLAFAYRASGRLDEAIALYETTLADRQRILGNDHPNTLTTQNNLAVAYRDAERLDEAIALYEKNLADRQRIHGADHPSTLTSRNNLAGSYDAVGRLDEAIALYETTLADRQRILGNDHPDTLTSRNNLAAAHQSAGRLDEAIALYETTLADRQRILGNDHPNTFTSRNNLAGAYQSAGRLDEAIALFETNLADRQRIQGDDHPDTLTGRNNLALAYWAADRRDEAIDEMERASQLAARALSPDHHVARGLAANVDGMRRDLDSGQ